MNVKRSRRNQSSSLGTRRRKTRDATKNLRNGHNEQWHRTIARLSTSVDGSVRAWGILNDVDGVVIIVVVVWKTNAPEGDISVIRTTRIIQVLETEDVDVDRCISLEVPGAVDGNREHIALGVRVVAHVERRCVVGVVRGEAVVDIR
jgi:hypothetical protein